MTDDPFAKSEAEAAREAELAAMAERPIEITEPLEDHHADLHGRLSEIEKRASEAKTKARAKTDFAYREERGQQNYHDTGKGLSTGMVVAVAIMGGPLMGYALGFLLDRMLGSDGWKPLIMLLGAVAGIAFTVKYVNDRNEK